MTFLQAFVLAKDRSPRLGGFVVFLRWNWKDIQYDESPLLDMIDALWKNVCHLLKGDIFWGDAIKRSTSQATHVVFVFHKWGGILHHQPSQPSNSSIQWMPFGASNCRRSRWNPRSIISSRHILMAWWDPMRWWCFSCLERKGCEKIPGSLTVLLLKI